LVARRAFGGMGTAPWRHGMIQRQQAMPDAPRRSNRDARRDSDLDLRCHVRLPSGGFIG
jgi:hypothetical protein